MNIFLFPINLKCIVRDRTAVKENYIASDLFQVENLTLQDFISICKIN